MEEEFLISGIVFKNIVGGIRESRMYMVIVSFALECDLQTKFNVLMAEEYQKQNIHGHRNQHCLMIPTLLSSEFPIGIVAGTKCLFT